MSEAQDDGRSYGVLDDSPVVIVLTRSEAKVVYAAVELEAETLDHELHGSQGYRRLPAGDEREDAVAERDLLRTALLTLCPVVFGDGAVPFGYGGLPAELDDPDRH